MCPSRMKGGLKGPSLLERLVGNATLMPPGDRHRKGLGQDRMATSPFNHGKLASSL